jgi:hypothetical protein
MAKQQINESEKKRDSSYLLDSRPQIHDGSDAATDQVLTDMALEDALNEMGW